MLMLTVGMHVPLRDRRLAGALRSGAYAAILVAVLAPLGGLAVAALAGTSHGAVYAVLLASGSAAVVVPALQERGLEGPSALVVIAQVTIADVATIVAVPLVLQPSRASHAVLGGLLVAACALAIFVLARWLQRSRLGSAGPEALQASRMGAGFAPLAAGALRLGMGRPKKRDQRADRRIWRRSHGRRDRWAQTSVDTGARDRRGLLRTAVLCRPRGPVGPHGTGRTRPALGPPWGADRPQHPDPHHRPRADQATTRELV